MGLLVFLSISVIMAFPLIMHFPISLPLYFLGGMVGLLSFFTFSKMSKSMADTGEIDAIAWLLKTAPQYTAALFKNAGQMTGLDSIGYHYRPRLLESIMPFLSFLIISHHAPEHHSSVNNIHSPSSRLSTDEDPPLKNLEIYIACLARLSDFSDHKGNFSCLWEDEMQHAKLEQPLVDKLVVLANPRHGFQVSLRSAATKVLNNYELDMEGEPVRSPATVEWSVGSGLRSAASFMLNATSHREQEVGQPNLHGQMPVELATRVEPHSTGEIEEA